MAAVSPASKALPNASFARNNKRPPRSTSWFRSNSFNRIGTDSFNAPSATRVSSAVIRSFPLANIIYLKTGSHASIWPIRPRALSTAPCVSSSAVGSSELIWVTDSSAPRTPSDSMAAILTLLLLVSSCCMMASVEEVTLNVANVFIAAILTASDTCSRQSTILFKSFGLSRGTGWIQGRGNTRLPGSRHVRV